jgi:phosphohistidine phosphatase
VNIYLVRHGEAVSERIDPARPLTRAGREEVERVADRAASQKVQVSAIFHSGILRAKQTAEIIAQRLGFSSGTRELSGLLPQDDPSIARAELETAESPIMLVGHLPHLSRLASLLVSGQMESEVVQFAPATMVCCATDVSGWKLAWTLAPQSR